ncbi:MAG: MarR family transcriptional regulator [Roseivirga sp.]|uniref:MarR family winged helix-turn-helix transcriptional regulator n=1 Tax=Roseivirga sp. TaxID=1964215 RepID=UPI001B24C5A9|nr:helix-turn-helix domain-containing protein [Roseivirga sp.]MBO6660880.1 MarR family transcriptional regulator [Roseivirga sp.]MBO6762441.1 MarR family transcriptional regulator [Roseivirga sp.]MBO6909136.1 MarR family transcriptional regulator [Roseivirga sp.]
MERNIINELGSLALATRLKNLSDRLAKDVAQIYKESDFDFEPRWFAVFYSLKDGNELAVMELSSMLQQSHPAVNQVANVLVKKGLVVERKDKLDQRKRLLKLSKKGLQLAADMEPLWAKIKEANDQLLRQSKNILASLEAVENALDKKSIKERL